MIPIYDKKAFGKFLKNGRIASGYNQIDVARELGLMGGQFLSNIERGLCPPPAKMLRELIYLYELNTDKVINILLKDLEVHLKKVLK